MMRLGLLNIKHKYDAYQNAVSDLSLEAAPGEVLCLLGPSGCGKSTTLRIAAGVERQSAGVVKINGTVVSDDFRHDSPETRGVGLMFQDLALFPHLSVLGNVAFGVRGENRIEQARAALARVGLACAASRYPHEISGGEQQRVALARALASQPQVMLLDEPFSSLDHRMRDAVRDQTLGLLKESGVTVLLVTHDPDEALRMSDRIALMRKGKIVQTGAPYHIYNHPIDREAAAFFSDLNIVHGVVKDQQTDTPFGIFFAPGIVDGADVEIVIRPQHLQVNLGDNRPNESAKKGVAAPGQIVRARFMGAHSLIETRMDHDGSVLTATKPGAFLPPPGERVWLSLRRDHCFVYPCSVQSHISWPYFSEQGAQRTGTAAALAHSRTETLATTNHQGRHTVLPH
jgi:iron(III) transport system ATP-binding protein